MMTCLLDIEWVLAGSDFDDRFERRILEVNQQLLRGESPQHLPKPLAGDLTRDPAIVSANLGRQRARNPTSLLTAPRHETLR